MKNKAVFFALAFLLALAAGVFKDVNDAEREYFRFELKPGAKITRTVDIAKQGWLKKAIQPQTFSVAGRIKAEAAYGPIYAKFTGTDGYLSQRGKKSVWIELKETDAVKLREKGYTPINIEVNVPRENTLKRDVGSARLSLQNDREILAQVDFLIINSDADK